MGATLRAQTAIRYRALDVSGSGETLATDTQLHRVVRLVRLPADTLTPAQHSRIRAMLGLSPHPAIAAVRDAFRDGDSLVLVTDAPTGEDAATAVTGSAARMHAVLADVAAALDHMHREGIAHGGDTIGGTTVNAAGAVLSAPSVTAVHAAPRDDRASFRRLARAMSAAAGAPWHRRLRGLVALVPRRRNEPCGVTATRHRSATAPLGRLRPAVAAALGLVILVVAVISWSDAPERPVRRARASAVLPVVSPVVQTVQRDVVGELPEAVIALAPPRSAHRALPPAPAMPQTRPRLAVYQHDVRAATDTSYPTAFDTYRLRQGASPVWQYRTTGLLMGWTHVAPMADGWLFFYRGLDGVLGTAPVGEDGRLGYGDASRAPSPGWTHVTSDGRNLVFLYRADTGAAMTLRYEDGLESSARSHENVGADYDLAAGLGEGRILLYRSRDGGAIVLAVGRDGALTPKVRSLPPALTALATSGHRLVGMHRGGRATLFDAATLAPGGTVDVGGGDWDRVTGTDDGFVAYSRLGGAARIVEADAAGARVSSWTLPPLPIVVTVW